MVSGKSFGKKNMGKKNTWLISIPQVYLSKLTVWHLVSFPMYSQSSSTVKNLFRKNVSSRPNPRKPSPIVVLHSLLKCCWCRDIPVRPAIPTICMENTGAKPLLSAVSPWRLISTIDQFEVKGNIEDQRQQVIMWSHVVSIDDSSKLFGDWKAIRDVSMSEIKTTHQWII